MSETDERHRLAEVFAAFMAMTGDGDTLQVRGPHMRGPTSPPIVGVSLRLQPDAGGPGVEVFVHPLGARLSAWAAERARQREGESEETPLDVDLRAAYRWGQRSYADAAELTRGLLERMEEAIRELPRQRSHQAAAPIRSAGAG